MASFWSTHINVGEPAGQSGTTFAPGTSGVGASGAAVSSAKAAVTPNKTATVTTTLPTKNLAMGFIAADTSSNRDPCQLFCRIKMKRVRGKRFLW
jgi:tellurite resistance protein TehA-like permease